MSTPITATVHSDPEIETIRTQVASKNDGIPYVLLPVKIETRFMTVDQPLVATDYYADVLEGLYRTYDILPIDPWQTPRLELLDKLREATGILADVKQNAAKLQGLTPGDKDPLTKQAQQLQRRVDLAANALDKLATDNDNISAELRRLSGRVKGDTNVIVSGIGKLITIKESEVSEATSLLSAFGTVTKAISTLATKKISATDRKAKRIVFAEIEEQLATIEDGIVNTRKQMAANVTVSKMQINQLRMMTSGLKKGLEGVSKNLDTLRSNYKQTEYRTMLASTAGRLQKLEAEINLVVLPKLEVQRKLGRVDAREVLRQACDIASHLRQINSRPIKNYEELKQHRAGLYDRLYRLRADSHKIIEGTSEEFSAIGRAWDRADAELEIFIKNVRKVSGKDRNEKAGLSRTITHLSKEYRKDLHGLRSGMKSSFPVLTNKVLENSILGYERSIQRFKTLTASIRSVDDSKTLKQLFKEIENFNKEFTVAGRNIHVLTQSNLKALQTSALELETSLEDALKRAGTKPPQAIKDAIASIKATADAQVSDTVERKDRFYDDVRSSIVFAAKTITKKELWVRIYPDDIAIHTHEEALTQQEADSGRAYWYEIWAAGDDADLKLAAWRAISTAYGPQRAAWIVKSLEPVTGSSSPASSFAKLSGKLLAANSSIEKINAALDKGVADRANAFEVLGTIYPSVKSLEEQLKEISSDNDTLLRKTHRLLLRSQSRIAKYLDTIKQSVKALSDKDRAERMQAPKLISESFIRTVEAFKKIRPRKSGDMIKEAAPANVFPTVEIKEQSWTEAPHSRVMPDRFVVLAMRDGVFRYMEAGSALPSGELVVGLDPATFDTDSFSYDEDGNLIVADSIKWLTDFNEARKIGMAISFELEEEDWDAGFDKVFVLGVKNTTATSGKQLLQDLIDNHHYLPEGASFLPIGTPTNNTKSGESGYRTFEEDASLSFEIERNSENEDTFESNPDYLTDSERLARAMGIQHSHLRHLDYSLATGISNALNFNKALFNGTIGAYMEEGLDTLFTLDNINRTKTFFTQYVSGRGYLPSIRVGTQPYGVLPTSALSLFEWTSNDNELPQLSKADFEYPSSIESELQTRFDIRLKAFLKYLNDNWTARRNVLVKHAGNMESASDPQEYFMDMLGLDATSIEYFFRYGLNVAARQNAEEIGGFSINFNSADPYSPTQAALSFRNLMTSGYYYQSDNFSDEQTTYSTTSQKLSAQYNRINDQFVQSRIFSMRHLEDTEQLLGEKIDHRELSEEVLTPSSTSAGTNEEMLEARSETDYYLDWLVNNAPWDVHAYNQFSALAEDGSITEGMPSKSLLFLLLRHSLLSAHADTMLKILEYEGLIDQKIRKKIGQAKYYFTSVNGDMTYVTRWSYLFSKLPPLKNVLGNNMDTTNPFYVYISNLSGHNDYLDRYISPAPEHAAIYNGYPLHANHDPFVAELDKTRDAIRKLKEIPTAELDRLLSEHLDLCSYRLDAWYLGLVNKRLDQQRAAGSSGSYIGAYGWVENLRRGGELTEAQNLPSDLWKSGDGPVYTDADNLGYIHTPSLNHAITAAILKAGFHANEATAETENQMAVNLSSERVRMALTLLNGIKGGQEAGALLGYQFERGLHERYLHLGLELDEFIYDFRDMFPLNPPVDDSIGLGQAAQNTVVNGMELLEFAQDFLDGLEVDFPLGNSLYENLRDNESAFWAELGNANLSSAEDDERDAMLREIDRMANAFDALGDLCISESVYQVARGNHVRASAILDKLSKGDIPNDISIADTPRTGTVVTHKVGLFIDRIAAIDHALTGTDIVPLSGAALDTAVTAAGARPAGWNSTFTPRALMEPSLNKWVGEMLGDPAHIKCLVEYTIPETETAPESTTAITVSLADMELQPLDVLYLFATGAVNGGAELNVRIANYTRSQVSSLPTDFEGTTDDVPVNIRYTERGGDWADEDQSFYEKSGYIQALRQLVTSSGILSADHLHIPGEEEVEANALRNQDVNELLIRVSNGVERLQLVYDELEAYFTDEVDPENIGSHTFTFAQIDTLREIMRSAAAFGIPASLPELNAGYENSDGQTLANAALGIYSSMADRLTRAAVEMTKAEDTAQTNDVRVDALVQAASCVMGAAFRVFPQFIIRNAAELSQQLSLSSSQGLLRAAVPEAMDGWAQGMGRVRERMTTLDTLQMLADNFDNSLPDMIPVQLPFVLDSSGNAADHWLGLPFPSGYSPSEDKLSVVLMNHEAVTVSPSDPKVCLLVDEWVEIIPNLEETTGLTFNYDQPNAKAPNTILLAVTPKVTGHWAWDDLVWTLNDTLELSKNRAVEPEHLEDTIFGQLIPGILTEIVPPQFIPTEEEDPDDVVNNPMGRQVVTDLKVNNETYKPEESVS